MIDKAQQTAAKVAGAMFLLTVAIVVAVNFAINAQLIVVGNPVETVRNILAHEQLFRLGIAGNLIYATGLMVLASALYVILRPVNRGLAGLAAAWRFVYAAMWVLTALNFFSTLRLLDGADYTRVLGGDATRTLANFYLSGFDQYYVGLLFYALASTACSWLWLESRYVPRVLAVFGLLGSAWCAICTILLYVFPNFPTIVNLWWFDTPMVLFEIALGVWLLTKGLQEPSKARVALADDR